MITVFTPTYNRAYIIRNLYESLCRQTCHDFEWLIVDDGSTDNTRELISQFQAENKINIRYIYKNNGGKHSAINRGVKEANGELFFIVDSDDYVTNDAVEWIIKTAESIISESDFAGLSGVRINPNWNRIGGKFPFERIDCNAIEIRQKYSVKGDLAEIYKTEILKLFPFPNFENERFVTEALIWNRIANAGYKLRYTSAPIYVCEYRPDGLTAHMTKLRMQNPKASMKYYSEYMQMPISIKGKIKTGINYWRFALCDSSLSFSKKISAIGGLSIFLAPIGYIFHLKDKSLQ